MVKALLADVLVNFMADIYIKIWKMSIIFSRTIIIKTCVEQLSDT